jgi:hypothetical protein
MPSMPSPLPVKRASVNPDAPKRPTHAAPVPPPVPASAPHHALRPTPRPAQNQMIAAAGPMPFFVGIEGELTVAGYDRAEGNIETYEGSSFILEAAASGGEGIPWDNFPFNVHYRCEESGKCILVRGSETAIARMTR